jgi:geranylgeranyl pyrophosphate synthase
MIKAAPAAGPAAYCTQVTSRVARLSAGLPAPLDGLAGELARRPGKLLRPRLVHACAAGSAADPAALVRLGAVVELLHLASLLHDDLIDRAAVRRGRPAAHITGGPEPALLAGLACFALAGAEAAELGPDVSRQVGTAVAGLSYGELLDVERAFDVTLTLPDYLELVERKTGDLFALACRLGAAAVRAEPGVIDTLAAFGRDLGVAFQVLDDCLDLSGMAAGGTGKPLGTDLLLGLFGAPALFALAADADAGCDADADGGGLARLLLSAGFGPDDLPTVRSRITARGGLTAARRLARDRHAAALARLDEVPAAAVRDAAAAVALDAWGNP